MSYADAQAKTDHPPSLIGDTASVNARLSEISARILKLADMLHGAEPKEVVQGMPPAAPPNSIRRNIDVAYELLNLIENTLTRIENRL